MPAIKENHTVMGGMLNVGGENTRKLPESRRGGAAITFQGASHLTNCRACYLVDQSTEAGVTIERMIPRNAGAVTGEFEKAAP